jgi:hypothetical protein
MVTGFSHSSDHQKEVLQENHTTGHESPEGKYKYSSNLSLTSALDGRVVNATPR